ncbi:hypothetical protein IC607_03435 [Cellulomonas sp. JH27-2]|uniref:hypothetical protein n=1 Tax=Cellulomonas sp. JH27-2 TaxID=2774139 RepID=UPI00177ABA1C|nr:hypothetical protein [Cellulomonas sp. JH27-2]MBD8058017.1 hypothetical protein [Cellulomonas sp. JH27-2]
MSTDLLAELRVVDDTGVVPLASIHRRAQTIRRRRRAGAALAVGAVAAVLVVGGASLPLGSPAGPPRAQAGTNACTTGYGFGWTDRSRWDAVPHADALASVIPPTKGLAPIRGVGISEERLDCLPAVPAAVLYATQPALRGISLWVDADNPYEGDPGIEATTVRGVAARSLALSDGEQVLSWSEPDHHRWYVEASGLTATELATALDALDLSGGLVRSASVPAAWSAAELPTPPTSRRTQTWTVQYGPADAAWNRDRVQLTVQSASTSPAQAASSSAALTTLTDVDGRLAAYTANGMLRWNADGIAYTLVGSGGLDRLRTLAERVEHVGLDDPLVTHAKDLADVADIGG